MTERSRLMQFTPRDFDLYRDGEEFGVAWVTQEKDYPGHDIYPPRSIATMPVRDFIDGCGSHVDEEPSWWARLDFVTPNRCPWPLPDKPELPLDKWEAKQKSKSLLEELALYVGEYARLPKDVSPRIVAAWILASSVPERARHAPPLAFLGPPGTGKTRAMSVLKSVARRAMILNSPSPASLYSLTDIFQPTLMVDEWTRLAPDIRAAIEGVLLVGFDSNNGFIARRKEHSEGVRFWRVFNFFAIGSKKPLPEDVMARCLPAIMREEHDIADIEVGAARAQELRTMILRYRLEVLAGMCTRAPVENARALVREKVKGMHVSDRGLDKATVLAALAHPYGCLDDVVHAITAAQEAAKAAMADSVEANVIRALDELRKVTPAVGGFTKIPLSKIHDSVWEDMIASYGMTMRQLEMDDQVKPEVLGPMIRVTLGLKTKREKGGIYLYEPDLQTKLEALKWRYGAFGKDEEAPVQSALPALPEDVPADPRWQAAVMKMTNSVRFDRARPDSWILKDAIAAAQLPDDEATRKQLGGVLKTLRDNGSQTEKP